MLRNYLIIAIRNLMKQKLFAFINIFGLAVGVTCCMILGLYIHHEWSYDRHHTNAERIYRVVQEMIDGAGNQSFTTGTTGALSEVLRNEIPGIRTSIRMLNASYLKSWMGTNDGQGFFQRVCLADPEILQIFNLPLLRGDQRTALTTPNGLLITESVARKYFDDADPIGKIIQGEDFFRGTYIITGVLKDLPETSLVQFDFLTSAMPDWSKDHWMRRSWEQWRMSANGGPTELFIVLEATARPNDIEQKLLSLVPRYAGSEVRGKIQHHLQPLVRAHLYARQDYGVSPSGNLFNAKVDIRRLQIAGILGAFILLLAGINFVNLSTARSAIRAKEVGMRKVVGAHRSQIVGQFLGESLLISFFAHLLALALVQLSLPWVSSWLGINLSLRYAGFWLLLPGSVLIIGIFAGSWPAFFISKFRPIVALKGELKSSGGLSLRRYLVLIQFSISSLLIATTWVVFSQWKFMVEKDLGYDKENVVILPIFARNGALSSRREEIRQRFLAHPNVQFACLVNNVPLDGGGYWAVRPEGRHEDVYMYAFDLDDDLLDVFGIKLIMGSDFSEDTQYSRWERYILNEAAVKLLGWTDPIGKTLKLGGRNTAGTVIGVVKDFNFQSVRERIKPLVLRLQGGVQFLCLRINAKDVADTMTFLKRTWTDLTPNRTFEYQFLDQDLEANYRADMKTGQMFSASAGLAILIACLGLVGLASFSTEQRKREIGIRKVLGATWPGLVALFTRDFIKLVLIANLLVLPVSVYLTRIWLDSFAYRFEPGPWPFVLSAGLSFLIAIITVFLITFRAAAKNPIHALRDE